MTTLRVTPRPENYKTKTRTVVTCALSMWYFLNLNGVEKRRGAAPTTLSGW
jgi:hypothetical protein